MIEKIKRRFCVRWNWWEIQMWCPWIKFYCTGGKHKAQGPNLALYLVLSVPAPCFYPAAAPSSCLTVKEYLHLYRPKIAYSPLKAATRLMWPRWKWVWHPCPNKYLHGSHHCLTDFVLFVCTCVYLTTVLPTRIEFSLEQVLCPTFLNIISSWHRIALAS